MTRLFADVRSTLEAAQAARAGFDGVFVEDAALAVAPLPALRPSAPGEAPALTLDDDRGRRTLHRFEEALPDAMALDRVAAAGGAGVLIGSKERLLDRIGIAGVGVLRGLCTARGLLLGVAGELESPDMPRLVALAPDIILLGRAVRAEHGGLDEPRLALMRDLVPLENGTTVVRAPAGAATAHRMPDLIFLRDLVLPIAIGAYAEERGRRQRVRFSVEAELQDLGRPTRDMRDVVSYDLFSDAIAALTTDRHVDFVETLAEGIAAAVLGHPRIRCVRITVEKLDIGPGAVGVSIERRKGI